MTARDGSAGERLRQVAGVQPTGVARPTFGAPADAEPAAVDPAPLAVVPALPAAASRDDPRPAAAVPEEPDAGTPLALQPDPASGAGLSAGGGRWRVPGLASFEIGRGGLVALMAVTVVAALVAVGGFLHGRPTAVPVTLATAAPGAGPADAPQPSPAGATPPATGAPAEPTTTPAALLVVDVAGEVRRPGVVRLPAGSRVVDAVRAAGGPLPGADLGLLNLASRLSDGQQVVVGVAAPPSPAGAVQQAAPSAAPVDLNLATADQLEQLPGVGPVLAQRIVDYRTGHGPFRTVDDLEQVPGIGPSTMAELRPLVTV